MTIYTPVSISGYNSNPPDDDGSAVASNEITWDKHKTKLGDPVKTLSEGIDTNVAAAFGKVLAASSSDLSTNTTLSASHHGKFLRITNSPTLTLTAAATLGDGWNCIIFNEGSGTVTISTGETINGASSITIPTQYDFLIISCDGTDFAATQSLAGLDNTFTGATNTFDNNVTISGTLTANAATTTVPGLVEKSTTAENTAGTSDKFPDAAGVKAFVEAFAAPFMEISQTSTTSVSGSTWTAIEFDTEVQDPDGWHDTVTNNTRVTVTDAGLYDVNGWYELNNSSAGDLFIAIAVNGTRERVVMDTQSSYSENHKHSIRVLLNLSASDYIELFVYQTGAGGGTATVTAGTGMIVKKA